MGGTDELGGRLRRNLGQLFFPVAPAERLAILRILVGAFSLFVLVTNVGKYMSIASSPPSMFMPVGIAKLLDGPLSQDAYFVLIAAAIALNVAFLAGFRMKVSGPLFALALLAVLTYRNSWTMVFHSANLLVLHVIVLGLTPSADAFSLDALDRRGRGTRLGGLGVWKPPPSPVDWRYGWGCQLICALTVAAYFLAGVAKVAGPHGLGWASGDVLALYIFRDGLRKELLDSGATEFAWAAHDMTLVLTLLAVFSLVLEVGAPVFFAWDRGRLWAVLTWGMHVGIVFTMDITFEYPLFGIAFASFFPLERLVPAGLRAPPGPPPEEGGGAEVAPGSSPAGTGP